MQFNDGHIDSIGEAILGLSLAFLIVAILSWPLMIERPAHDGFHKGGCCSSTLR
jgi:hypothetical protein